LTAAKQRACRLGYRQFQFRGDNAHPDHHQIHERDRYAFYTGMEAARTRQSLGAALRTLELPASHNGLKAIGN
jgi:hypothetical protein